MHTTRQSERLIRIQALHDYLMRHMTAIMPDQVMERIRGIRAAFPPNSHTTFLADITIEQIDRLWLAGQLDRITLFTLANLMLFERYISNVNLKRTFIDAVRFVNMREFLSAPTRRGSASNSVFYLLFSSLVESFLILLKSAK